MSGRKIDDHSFWAGGKSKSSVFPEGVHTKNDMSAEGAGSISKYEDTTETIRAQQDKNISKAKALPQKPLYRN